ncbi:hypothetical protein JCM15519_20160 [Fundidesulfovibrio butyratiphilus]
MSAQTRAAPNSRATQNNMTDSKENRAEKRLNMATFSRWSGCDGRSATGAVMRKARRGVLLRPLSWSGEGAPARLRVAGRYDT